MTRSVLALLIVTSALATSVSGARAQEAPIPDPSWQIAHVRGGLYRVNAGPLVTVFFVTGDGIVVVDPLSLSLSMWLKRELENRFPQEPVRYVVYTHHHFDRASGASPFDETAEIIAHEAFSEERNRSAQTLPSTLVALDRNGNGRLDRDEASGTTEQSLLATYDRNEDGSVTPGELYSYVRTPERTYRTRRSITLNGKTVELLYTRTSHAADMTAVYFPAERVLFGADLISVRSVPPTIGPDPRRTIASTIRIEELMFDILLTGTGEEGTTADIGVFRQYLLELSVGVRAGYNAGLTLDETKRTVTLGKFSTLSGFPSQREAHIAEVYGNLRPVLTSLYGATNVTFLRVESEPCQAALYDSCVSSSGFAPLGGTIGINTSIDRLTVGGEISSAQTKTTRLRATDSFFPPYEHVHQHRDLTASFLVGYRLGRPGGTIVTIEGGPSLVFASNRLAVFSTTNSGDSGTEKSTGVGLTIGTSIVAPLTGKYSIVVPVRLTTADRGGARIGPLSFTAGAGLLVNVARGSR